MTLGIVARGKREPQPGAGDAHEQPRARPLGQPVVEQQDLAIRRLLSIPTASAPAG
jgi:hypothetical protein